MSRSGNNGRAAGDRSATDFDRSAGKGLSENEPSLLFRLILWWKAIWRQGVLCRFGRSVQLAYAQSVSCRLWEGFCGAPDPVRSSLYWRLTEGVRHLWRRFGELLAISLTGRAADALDRGFRRLIAQSGVFRLIGRWSPRRWLLVAFAMYLPIGYVIRVAAKLPLLASAWEELFILAAIGLLLWRSARKRSVGLGRQTSLEAWMLLFMAVGLLLMMLVRPYPAVALPGYRAAVEYMIWFFLIIRLIEDDRDAKILYGAFVLMSGLLCLHGIYQYVVATPIPASWVSQTEMGVRTRVFSLTGSPNIFGSLIVLSAPMMAALAYYQKKPLVKFGFFCLTGLACLCLLFTFSRGAWIGMVVAVLLFAVFVDRRLIAIMGAAAATALVFVPSITSRLTYLFTADYAEASAIGGRALRWEIGRLLLTENNPWLGFGLGRFGGAVAMNNQLLDKTETFEYFYMDNYYLKTMVEMGYIGLFFFLLLIAAFAVWGLRAIYRSGEAFRMAAPAGIDERDALVRNVGNPKLLAVGIFAGQAGVLAHCYFENIFEEPYMMAYFWGLAGLLMYFGFFAERSRR